MPSRTEPRPKKDRGDATQKRCPQPDLPVHAGPAAPAPLPAAPHRPTTSLGYLEIRWVISERSMRPLALTRKNALFAGSDGGAAHWAVIASLVETCKLIGVEP